MINKFFGICTILLLFQACKKEEQGPLYSFLSPEESGITFSNDLSFDKEFNVYTYRNFYNGGGVSIGDINGDDLPDIYFTANLKKNKLYLNKGDLQFEDITTSAGVEGNRAWSTGVTMADINGDGLMDIYVCNSGDIAGDNKENELFINNGDLTFTESASEYGIADEGYSTHASFFDYDKDGDLDAYILNNSYQSIGSFNLKKNERPIRDKLGGDKLMENVEGKFVDVSEASGIYGSIIGFGLGVTVGDVNGDYWDDIYISNDFFERDYLYINNQDGTFSEELTKQIKSISGASMGADMADMNNDGRNDIFVTEMLPNDYERLKSVTTFEDWNRYRYSVDNDYYHQFTRNTFQVNTGNNSFQELSRFSGIEATDWSWGALIYDMDNDGLKDLYVANGIYQDLTDQDYIQYISNEEVARSIITSDGVDYNKLIEIIPSNPISNFAYHNQGELQFEDKTADFGLHQPGFSNGSAYADLDNDGDLDLVVNNVNSPAWLYRNNASDLGKGNFIQFDLKGLGENKFAIGTKIMVSSPKGEYYVEQQPIRGFQSSVDPRPHLGLSSNDPVNIKIVWPTGRITLLEDIAVNQKLTLSEDDAKIINESVLENNTSWFSKVNNALSYKHEENDFVDFDRDRLLNHMRSTEGPKMSIGDVNGDGIGDVFIGGARGFSGKIYMGNSDGSYKEKAAIDFDQNKNSEDAESVFFDLDGDNDLDLYVCSGGAEFSQSSTDLLDRLYVNDGEGNFVKQSIILPSATSFVSSSCVSASDIDSDGDIDLFVGERMKPGRYGEPGSGFILINDDGVLREATKEVAPELVNLGMITDGEFTDVNGDGEVDLVIVGEFMGMTVFSNSGGKFLQNRNDDLDNAKGWWNTITTVDIDKDGDNDFVLGNHGLNSRFKTSKELPISLFVNDFDHNGSLDPILAKYHSDGQAYPYALRHNLIDQIKDLKKKYVSYDSFKSASMQNMFDAEILAETTELKIEMLYSVVVRNEGGGKFAIEKLPFETQVAPIYAITAGDYDKDGDMDLIVGGNLYGTKPEVGRYDASNGTLLINDGKGNFSAGDASLGLVVDGEIRSLISLDDRLLIGRNSDSLLVFKY